MAKYQRPIPRFTTDQIVFVYGSLRDRLSNNGYLYVDAKTQQLIPEGGEKETFTVEGFQMFPIQNEFPFSYPFCVEGEGSIQVECYKVSPLCMMYLDQLEGYPNMYDAKKVTSVEGVEALMYYMREDQTTKKDMPPEALIAHGDWRKFLVEGITDYVKGIK